MRNAILQYRNRLGEVVRIPAFHVGGPSSIPGVGIYFFFASRNWKRYYYSPREENACRLSVCRLSHLCIPAKRFELGSPNLVSCTTSTPEALWPEMTSPATSFRQQTPFWKKKFCWKWTTGPRITKFGTEVQHNTLVNYVGIGASSYFRSATIRHFYFFYITSSLS